jgi:multidrug efflux pump subunit AcrA (membrane-fusion protein)
VPAGDPVTVVPREALLRTAEGVFVYVANGPAYLRTPVVTGAEDGSHVGIVDGLYAGDVVVTRAVEALWLIELRATKGGGHSH